MGGLDEAVSVTRSITYKERKYLAPRLEAIVTSALSGLAEKKDLVNDRKLFLERMKIVTMEVLNPSSVCSSTNYAVDTDESETMKNGPAEYPESRNDLSCPPVRHQPSLPGSVPRSRTERLVAMREMRLAHASTLDQVEADGGAIRSSNSVAPRFARLDGGETNFHQSGQLLGGHQVSSVLMAPGENGMQEDKAPPRLQQVRDEPSSAADLSVSLAEPLDAKSRYGRALSTFESHDFSGGALFSL